MSQDLEAIFRAIWYPKHWAKSCLIKNAGKNGMKHVQKYETSKHAVKSSSTKKHTAPYFVSHLDSMSSNKLTSHSHYFQSVSRFWNLCSASAIQPHFIQSYLIYYLSLCTSATQLMCEPCNVLQSGPRFDFIQPFFLFWNLCSASAIQLLMDLCNAFAIQPISFFRCKSKLFQFNSFPWQWRFVPTFQWLRPPCSSSIKLQISNPRFPLLLFTLSHTPTQKLHYRSTHLSGYSANFQCCKSGRTPCQPSGSTRCPTNMTQGSQRKPSRVNNTKSILFEKFISTKENAPPKM